MSLLGVQFRSMAARLQVIDYNSKELDLENIYPLIEKHLNKKLLKKTIENYDITDPYTVWGLLSIDAIISLEDIDGNSNRVGVYLQAQDSRAYQTLNQAKAGPLAAIRKALKIYQYWVFCVDAKNFPTDEEWMDILYSEIDKSNTSNPSRVIII